MEHRLNLFGNPYFRVAFRELDNNNDGRVMSFAFFMREILKEKTNRATKLVGILVP